LEGRLLRVSCWASAVIFLGSFLANSRFSPEAHVDRLTRRRFLYGKKGFRMTFVLIVILFILPELRPGPTTGNPAAFPKVERNDAVARGLSFARPAGLTWPENEFDLVPTTADKLAFLE